MPVEKTRGEIEKLLGRFGATKFMSGWDQLHATIAFVAKDRHVRFVMPLPSPTEKRFTTDKRSGWRTLTKDASQRLYDAELRRLWRSLLLVIKAKLEAVESGVSEFEAEFLAHIVLPGGVTVGETLLPRIAEAYASGSMPTLMLGPGA